MTDVGTKCDGCGQFISYDDMDPITGTARHFFEPLNEFGPEISEWICGKCAIREMA